MQESDQEAQQCNEKRELIPGPPSSSSHAIKNRLPLVCRDIRSHVFVHALSRAAIETSDVKCLHDAKVLFDIFLAIVGCVEDSWSFDVGFAQFHMLGKS